MEVMSKQRQMALVGLTIQLYVLSILTSIFHLDVAIFLKALIIVISIPTIYLTGNALSVYADGFILEKLAFRTMLLNVTITPWVVIVGLLI